MQNHCLIEKEEHVIATVRWAQAQERSAERAQLSLAPQPAGRTSARQPRAASKSQAAENDSCQVSAKWCADSQPPIVCVLGQLPSPGALAKDRGRSPGCLTSALPKLQQRRQHAGLLPSHLWLCWRCQQALPFFPRSPDLLVAAGQLRPSSRLQHALISW